MRKKAQDMSDKELKNQLKLMAVLAIVTLAGIVASFAFNKIVVLAFLVLGLFTSLYFKTYVTEITKRRNQGSWSLK